MKGSSSKTPNECKYYIRDLGLENKKKIIDFYLHNTISQKALRDMFKLTRSQVETLLYHDKEGKAYFDEAITHGFSNKNLFCEFTRQWFKPKTQEEYI